MKLKICWMYHDFMDLYGDAGNIMVLQKRCERRGIDCIVDTCAMHQEKDLNDFDLVFLGGGADREQKLLIEDLYARKANIEIAIKNKTFFFLVCGGYQLFGKYYITSAGEKIPGLGLYSYYTKAGKEQERCIGNVATRCQLDDAEYIVIGFENHAGQTFQVESALGEVLHGKGNSLSDVKEGFYNGQVFGTYMHGPLLPKNPEIADFFIYKALNKKHSVKLDDLKPLDDCLENKAREHMFKIMGI